MTEPVRDDVHEPIPLPEAQAEVARKVPVRKPRDGAKSIAEVLARGAEPEQPEDAELAPVVNLLPAPAPTPAAKRPVVKRPTTKASSAPRPPVRPAVRRPKITPAVESAPAATQAMPVVRIDVDEFAFAPNGTKVKTSKPAESNVMRLVLVGVLAVPVLVLGFMFLNRSSDEEPVPSAPPVTSAAPAAPQADRALADAAPAVSEECGNSFAYASVHTDGLARTTGLCGSPGEWKAAAREYPIALGGAAPGQSLQAVCASTPQAAACTTNPQ